MSLDLTAAPTTDPLRIYQYRDCLYAADLIAAALVHLGFFSWLSENPSSKEIICAHFGTTERPTDVMLTLFAANGFVENRDGAFHATELAREHLSKDSPWNLGPYYDSLHSRPIAKDFLEGSHLSFLEEVATRLLGRKAKVRLQVREGVKAAPVPVEPPPPRRDPMEEFKDDALIRKALEDFRGRLELA